MARRKKGAAKKQVELAVAFSREGWEDYLSWEGDPKVHAQINRLIEESRRTPFAGTGKPEPLKHPPLQGYWSRRITGEHRMVYKSVRGQLAIIQLRYHY